MTTTQTTTARVRCINKSDRYNAHERIKSVGGVNSDGRPWKLTEQHATDGIEQRTYSSYVERPEGSTVKLVVAKTAAGRRYLKTEADGEQPDNLLSLPECP